MKFLSLLHRQQRNRVLQMQMYRNAYDLDSQNKNALKICLEKTQFECVWKTIRLCIRLRLNKQLLPLQAMC